MNIIIPVRRDQGGENASCHFCGNFTVKQREIFYHFTSAILNRSWAIPRILLFLNYLCCRSVPPQCLTAFSPGIAQMWKVLVETIGCSSYRCIASCYWKISVRVNSYPILDTWLRLTLCLMKKHTLSLNKVFMGCICSKGWGFLMKK